jgi:Flp pilus assembly protein TadG
MVEAAIVMPLLMLLVFGIIEWGLAFLSATSTNSAARSGARTASALTLNTTYADQARLAVESNLSSAIPFATPLGWRKGSPQSVGSPY